MTPFTALYLPIIISLITIWMTVEVGRKKRYSWIIGIIGNSLHIGWIFLTGAYGYLLVDIAMIVLFARNYWLWRL